MLKVQVLTTCSFCQGKAYLPLGEALSATGEPYTRYAPCPSCEGSGNCPQWVSLEAFAALLVQHQCPHLHTSHTGRIHFSAGDVWDDIAEVCDDCGAKLDN